MRADTRVDDSHDDQGDRDNGEEREGCAGGFVSIHAWWGIHSDELEEEVCETAVEEKL